MRNSLMPSNGQANGRTVLSSDGYTLIELMVVMSLIMILAAVALPQYKQSVVYAREAVLKEDLFRLRDAIDQFFADKGHYPESLEALSTEGYVRKIPVDPFTNAADTWQTTPSEPDPGNPASALGVLDVTSGSDRTALDGTKYSEWR
jgi:general secretion pathway protein G